MEAKIWFAYSGISGMGVNAKNAVKQGILTINTAAWRKNVWKSACYAATNARFYINGTAAYVPFAAKHDMDNIFGRVINARNVD